MTSTDIKRILVALDPSEINRGLLQSATDLARQLDAELNALFVEDINLLKLAELPIAREITFGSATGRQISVANMERSLASQTSRLRNLVSTIAQKQQISIALDVLRGDIASLVCDAAKHTDLLVVGKKMLQPDHTRNLGRVTRAVISKAECNLILMQHRQTIDGPLVVFFDGSEASLHALNLAKILARENHSGIFILYPAVDNDRWQQLDMQIRAYFGPDQDYISTARLSDTSPDDVLALIRLNRGKLLMLTGPSEYLPVNQMQELVSRLGIPVIILRKDRHQLP